VQLVAVGAQRHTGTAQGVQQAGDVHRSNTSRSSAGAVATGSVGSCPL
jgi:hypothetical protein